MPDSARQNAQPGAPAPLEEFENGMLEKKQKREHGEAAYAGPLFCLFLGIYRALPMGVGGGPAKKV